MPRPALILTILSLLSSPAPMLAQTPAARPLAVVSSGPSGEVAALAEANEIRIVFSEPMVTLGRIPAPVRAPFVRITPAVAGTFRWSGTTILIFTPDPKKPLPFATKYEVSVETTAVAVSGRTLAAPHRFTFTTPTVKLLETSWYRRGGRAGAPMVMVLRFNQRVRAADVLAHLTARFEPHDWVAPVLPAATVPRLREIDPQAPAAFAAKVAATRVVASATGPVAVRLTTDWDRKRFPAAPNMVVLETTSEVRPESWVRLQVDPQIPSPAGPATPAVEQHFTIEVEKAFFVNGFKCTSQCDPDGANPVEMRAEVTVTDFAKAVKALDLSATPARAVAKPATPPERPDYEPDASADLTLEDAGFTAQPPSRTYAVTVDANLTSVDGQTLGYSWSGTAANWHQRAFTSFGDGHGVWESSGGTVLPFYGRNMRNVTQWSSAIAPNLLMPTLLKLQPSFSLKPDTAGTERRLGGQADRIVSHGLDLTTALGPARTGLVWTAIEEGAPIAESKPYGDSRVRASVIQVTNLGITVKDSPRNTLVFVTRLDTGAPVAGAKVSIVGLDNRISWSGTTGADGVVMADNTPLRESDDWWKFAFLVTAEKDGDIAYTGSDWNEGIQPWDFDVPFNLHEAAPLLRGTVFSDRGVYKLGEEVTFKAVLRENAADGIHLLPAGTSIFVNVRDGQNRVVDERTVRVNTWSSAEWTLPLPTEGTLGNYHVRVMRETDRPKPKTAEQLRPGETPGPQTDDYVPYYKVVNGSFLVAAYRRPDFRVDVALTGDQPIAGDPIKGNVTARYLFGAPMGTRPVTWTLTRSPLYDAPPTVTAAFPSERWFFVGASEDDERQDRDPVRREEAKLTTTGERPLQLATKADAGVPYSYTLEGDVEDVSRQHLANRASLTVHPAPWYIGVRRPPYFIEQKNGLKTEVVAVKPDGTPAAGVPVTVTLTQIQWNSVRRAEGNGFYTWDTERKKVPAGSWTVTSAETPVPLDITLPNGGYFVLEARAESDGGRFALTTTSFYALGNGYTAWARFDHNRIDLVPERKTYKPGDTARIMIQSPWEQATALVTTEREGIRSHRQFALTSTQQSIEVPIADGDIPNMYVSVLLVKGRSNAAPPADAASGPATPANDTSDPGKPSFRLGYVELKVEDASRRLTVALAANKQEYRPGNAAKVTVDVNDRQGRAAPSEVTLWAVDYGVLSLTAYRTPDILRSVYVEKALQVMTTDNRQRIVSRRVLTPKGDTDGGGGGGDAGAGTLRKDFRVLAFWVGSVATDANGHADVDVKLPESLTTYRIMAVAADRGSRFGSADTEVRINKPLTMKATFPRFLAVGDKATFGAVVTSQLPAAGSAVVTIKSLDPDILLFNGLAEQTLPVGPGGSIEARFDAAGRAIGRARVQMTVKMGTESDAFEDVIPVEILASPETVAAYGEATDATAAAEKLTMPAGVLPGFGGLHVELSSTALVGLGEGARYLVEYPYGCAEQRGSRALALLLAADLGDAFSLPGMDTSKMRPAVQQTLKELEKYQCSSGGFAYWPGNCRSVSPYLTAYLLHIFKTASDLKYDVDAGMRARAYAYLEKELAEKPPVNESWWPSYTAWQAFAVKVLVEGGRNQDSNLTRLYGYRERMPVFALAYLHDALTARGARADTAARLTELRRRMSNAVLPEAGQSHVEELSDPYLLWFWNSNVRTTAIVLETLVRAGAVQPEITPIVRWLMAARRDGRWGNTQENAYAMQALVAYYRKYESVVPSFAAVVSLGSQELTRNEFRGRSTETAKTEVPMAQLLSKAQPGTTQPLTFSTQGTGTLFYTARFRYASDASFLEGLDNGVRITRSYAPFVETGSRPAATSFKAGDLIRVTLTFQLTKERRYLAVTDPLPAGVEPVESWFATTAATLGGQQDDQGDASNDWTAWWQRGGFDHVERHDDRVELFATRLSEGRHVFSYVVRATTAGTFRTAPARAEEMYTPEIFGRTATSVVEIKK
ncbi:MAG: MG2 domain-containing protein [Vicinamibacterales bacterium]